MKKIFSGAMLLLAGMLAITSCTDDRDSNPTLVSPTEFKINTLQYSQAVDLATSTEIPVTWSQPVYTSPNAPISVNYTIEISKDGNFTKSYAEAEAEAKADKASVVSSEKYGQNYMALENAVNTCSTTISATELNQVLNKLHAGEWAKTDVIGEQKFVVRVKATPKAASTMSYFTSTNTVTGYAIPSWIDPNQKKITYIYVPGNGQGWAPASAPCLVCENNDDVYTGYAYMNGQFKFTKLRDWSGEYNNTAFSTASDCIDLTRTDDSNIDYTGTPGLCYFKVDIANKNLECTPVTWGVIGLNGDWDNDIVMTYDTTNKCLEATVTATSDTKFKFRQNKGWDVNYGGSIDNLSAGGDDISIAAGTYKIQLFLEGNDFTGDGSSKPTIYAKVTPAN